MSREDAIRGVHERFLQIDHPLNELQRRHWAAAEALNLGRGGVAIVSKALRMSPNTIKRGIQEITASGSVSFSSAIARIRKPGGGRKSTAIPADCIAPEDSIQGDPGKASTSSPAVD